MKTYTVTLVVSGTIEYTVEAKSEKAAEALAEAQFWQGVNADNPADCSLLRLSGLEIDHTETEED